jgi:hypothetical protein
MKWSPDGRLFVLEQAGHVRIIQNGAQKNRITCLTSSKADPNVGGAIFIFGKDRMLYAASAHGGSQSLNDPGGKILRLNPAADPDIIPRTIPMWARRESAPRRDSGAHQDPAPSRRPASLSLRVESRHGPGCSRQESVSFGNLDFIRF